MPQGKPLDEELAVQIGRRKLPSSKLLHYHSLKTHIYTDVYVLKYILTCIYMYAHIHICSYTYLLNLHLCNTAKTRLWK